MTDREKANERARNYYWAHQEERRKYYREYYANHKEQVKANQMKYYNNNREKVKERQTKYMREVYYPAHREEILAQRKAKRMEDKNDTV